MIDWQAFDWPSFATMLGAVVTLIVGIAAVVGAYKVGVRQAGIAERQTGIAERQSDIMSRQVALDEATLKAALFERRLATYEIACDFVLHLSDLGDADEGKARIDLYATKMRESQFLFRSEVYSALVEIWEAGNRLRVARATSISFHQERMPRNFAIEKTIDEHIQWSMRRIETLHEVFRPDLEVGYDLLPTARDGIEHAPDT